MLRALTRVTLLVVAPPAPVAWSPGTPPLSDMLRARVLAGAGAVAERSMSVMPASGRRMVALPVERALGRLRAPETTQRLAAERVAIPVASLSRTTPTRMPWAAAEPVPGVVVTTSQVPMDWLRPPAPRPATVVAMSHAPALAAPAPAAPAPAEAEAAPRPTHATPERAMPTSMRIRKAAVMALGLFVSLVAVEAAARVGRR